MPIQEGDFIRLSFSGYANGVLFDTTDEQKARDAGIYDENRTYGPKIVCAGKRQIIQGLDEALVGKEIGFEETIEIPPEKAFGEHEQELLRSYKKKAFLKKPEIGMQLTIADAGKGTVVDVIGNRVIVDFNHPLAGRALMYTYRIEGIVESATEKIAGLIKLLTGLDMEVHVEGSTALIELPAGVYYMGTTWLSAKPYITSTILDAIKEIDELKYIEIYRRKKSESEG